LKVVNKMSPQIRPRALLLLGLIVIVYPLFSGCTSLMSDCGGEYSATTILGDTSIQLPLNRSDAHFNNWTKAQISTKFTTETGVLKTFNYTYLKQTSGQDQYTAILLFNKTNSYIGDRYEKFSMTDWTKFTIETRVISDDPVLKGYTFFNGSSIITGKLKVVDTGTNGHHRLDTPIIFNKDYPGVTAQSPPGSYNKAEINLKMMDYTYHIVTFTNVGVKC